MSFYKLDEKVVINITTILNSTTTMVKVADAHHVVALSGLLRAKSKDGFYSIPEETHNFLVDLLENVAIKGKFAFAMVEVFEALGKSYDVIPGSKPVAKTKAPKATKKGDKNVPAAPPPRKGNR